MQDPTLHKLQERIKELTALHKTARILQNETLSPREVLQAVLSLLPPAWQYPEITQARICYRELNVTTSGFCQTAWIQSASFSTHAQHEGKIEIAYLEERPPEVEGPFLAEERELIESLADMLGSYFQQKATEQELQAAHDNLEQLVQQRTNELQRTNEKLAEEIVQHNQARQRIEEYQDKLRQLATEFSLAEARARREIAVDLHDHIIQEFAFIKLRILQFRGDAVFCGFEKNLEEIITLLEKAIQYTRNLTFEISTPILYELGLPAALEWLAEQYETRHKLPVVVKSQKLSIKLPEAIRVTLFKCVQELLTNAVKYAQAEHVTVSLNLKSNVLSVEVADNGCGFDLKQMESTGATQTGFGLFSIRERLRFFGGELHLQSTIGKGTTAILSVPVEV
jgi:signal transduction histidine kinase